MKKIEIYHENSTPIIIFDDDSTELKSYIEKINNVFNSPNIVNLEIDNKIIVVRPSKLNSIVIENVKDNKKGKVAKPKKENNENKKQEEENIITDGDK